MEMKSFQRSALSERSDLNECPFEVYPADPQAIDLSLPIPRCLSKKCYLSSSLGVGKPFICYGS